MIDQFAIQEARKRAAAAVARNERRAARSGPISTEAQLDRRQITVCLPQDLHNKFAQRAREAGLTRGELFRQLVVSFCADAAE